MRRKIKSQSDILFADIIQKNTVPMLVEYTPFMNMVRHISVPEINEKVSEIKQIFKEEKQQRLKINNLKKEKSRIAAEVLYYSNELNANGNDLVEKELEKAKHKLISKNEEIDMLEQSIVELFNLKHDLNINLLKYTLDYSYSAIIDDEKKLNKLLKDIEKYRQALEKMRYQRDELQVKIESTYGFIHGLMGAKNTEKIDEKLL